MGKQKKPRTINKYKNLLKNIKLEETSFREFLKRKGDKLPPEG
jgi:hypothetical protein